jgi:hypothetical protein
VNKTPEDSMHVRNVSDKDSGEMQVEDLNCSVTMLKCILVKPYSVAKRNRIGYAWKGCTRNSLQTLPQYSIFPICHSLKSWIIQVN